MALRHGNATFRPMAVWLRRTLISIAVGLVLSIGAVALILTHLEHPWVKARVSAAAGQPLDYRVATLRGLSGIHLEGLVVSKPDVHLETLDVTWSLFDLPKLETLTARGLVLTLVPDERPAQEPAGPKQGLSRQLVELMSAPRAFDQLDLSEATVVMPAQKLTVKGLTLTAKAEPDGPGWQLKARLGDDLELARDTAQASLKLQLQVELSKTGASAGVELSTSRQTFAPDYALKELLHAKATARFESDRVVVDLEPSRVAGVANLEGGLVLPDDEAAAPVLTRAKVDAQLAPLLALLPPQQVGLAEGTLALDATDVTLSAVPRAQALQLHAAVKQLRAAGVTVDTAQLEVVAEPGASPDALTAKATLRFEGLEVRGDTTVRAPSGKVELRVAKLGPAPASPLGVAGDVALSAALPALTADTGGLKAAVEKLALEATAPLPQREPLTLKADLPLGALRLTDAAGKRLLSAPARLQLDVTRATVAGDGAAKAELDVGTLHATLDATKGGEALGYTLALQAPELGIVTPFLAAETAAKAPWSKLSAKLDSTGRVDSLSSDSPNIEHRTTLAMPRFEWGTLALGELGLALHSKGDAFVHEGDAELKTKSLRAGEKELGAQHVTATMGVDRRKLSLRAGLTTLAGPKVALNAVVAFEPKRKALKCNLKGELKDAAQAGPLLAALDLQSSVDVTRLQTSFSFDGVVLGLVEDVTTAGEVRVVKRPLDTLALEGKLAFDAEHLRWQGEGQTVATPKLQWRAELEAEGARRGLHSTLRFERVSLVQGEKRTTAHDLTQELSFSIEGPLENGALSLQQTMKAASIERRPELPVPVKSVTFALAADRNAGGLIRLHDVQLTNPDTRTQLSMKGTLDLSDDRRQLTVRGTLEQDLAALKLPDTFEGRGQVTLAFRVASPDLDVFRVRSKLKLKDVDVKTPDGTVDADGLDGEVAINESFMLGDDGLKLTREIDANPYSMLRYEDQHPLLAQNSFITAKRIATQYGDIAPFAGNLAVEQNVVSLSQLELGIRGGRVTGQCTLDLQGNRSTLEAHVRATGVQSSRGEPFDGNAAVVISAHDRSINGRAEILRIGNQHLRDLLDIQDPQRIDPAINRVRTALSVGYPDHLRLVFDHGFASMRISFGGAARLLKVDDVRGIPVGPLVSRALSSVSLPQ